MFYISYFIPWNSFENYEIAINDPKNTWICHHKNGILLHKSAKELDEIGLYYNRPPEELIFVTKSEHKTLHLVFDDFANINLFPLLLLLFVIKWT